MKGDIEGRVGGQMWHRRPRLCTYEGEEGTARRAPVLFLVKFQSALAPVLATPVRNAASWSGSVTGGRQVVSTHTNACA